MTPLSKEPFPLICIYLKLHLVVNLSAHTRCQSYSSPGRTSPLAWGAAANALHGKVCSPYISGSGSTPTLLVMSSLVSLMRLLMKTSFQD